MWPWEHAAVGYLLLSLGLRALGRPPPSDAAALLVGLGGLLPDLVDKPLSWGLDLFTTGYALGHSVFFAIPIGLFVVDAGLNRDRPLAAGGFVVGYWAHLAADVLDPLRYGLPPAPERVLWPTVDAVPYEQDLGLGRGVTYLGEFLATLATMDPLTVVGLYLLLPLATLALWLLDGVPGIRFLLPGVDADRESDSGRL